jgi:hypothetical protein
MVVPALETAEAVLEPASVEVVRQMVQDGRAAGFHETHFPWGT